MTEDAIHLGTGRDNNKQAFSLLHSSYCRNPFGPAVVLPLSAGKPVQADAMLSFSAVAVLHAAVSAAIATFFGLSHWRVAVFLALKHAAAGNGPNRSQTLTKTALKQ